MEEQRLNARVERFKKLLKTRDDLQRLTRRRWKLYLESSATKSSVSEELENEAAEILKKITAYQLMQTVGVEYENVIYPLRRKLLKTGKVKEKDLA